MKLKNSFLRQDERAFTYVNGVKQFKADKDFQLHLENEINIYKEILATDNVFGAYQTQTSVNPTEEIKDAPLRQRGFVLLLLLFNKLEVPSRSQKPLAPSMARLSEFFQFMTGRKKDAVEKFLKNPTKYNEQNNQSRNKLLDDLRQVRTQLKLLGYVNRIRTLEAEAKAIGLDIDDADKQVEK
jgi:hypothetical protein